LQERIEALMMVIVKNVTAGGEEMESIAVCKGIEKDLQDLIECVGYTSRRAYSS